ncbi:MAG: hypothetical protein INF43_01945 [Alphaproteobacteria bacterium]|jgi:hypothetical protein|nr:hypothetical protein [Alphaproteobacteria bacterium]
MRYISSIRAEKKRDRKLQTTRRTRNKAGKFLGRVRIVMRDKRVNGKTGRYAVTQG